MKKSISILCTHQIGSLFMTNQKKSFRNWTLSKIVKNQSFIIYKSYHDKLKLSVLLPKTPKHDHQQYGLLGMVRCNKEVILELRRWESKKITLKINTGVLKTLSKCHYCLTLQCTQNDYTESSNWNHKGVASLNCSAHLTPQLLVSMERSAFT